MPATFPASTKPCMIGAMRRSRSDDRPTDSGAAVGSGVGPDGLAVESMLLVSPSSILMRDYSVSLGQNVSLSSRVTVTIPAACSVFFEFVFPYPQPARGVMPESRQTCLRYRTV